MPLPPALSKNYCTYANIPFPNTSTTTDVVNSFIFNLKLALMNQLSTGTLAGTRNANSVWTCVGSSNGTTGGMDGVDRWGTTYNSSNFVRSTARSWFVFYNSTLNLYFTIDLNSGTITNWRMVLSKTAPSTPSPATAAIPAISDGSVWGLATNDTPTNAAVVFAREAAVYDFFSHITFTDDGQFFYLSNRGGDGYISTGVVAAKLTGGNVGDIYNYGMLMGGANTGASIVNNYGFGWPNIGVFSSTIGAPLRGVDNSAPSGGFNIWDFGGATSTSLGQAQYSDIITNDVYLYPMSVWSTAPFAYRGYLADCYNVIGGKSGIIVPSTANPSWILLNKVLLPWVGAAPIL